MTLVLKPAGRGNWNVITVTFGRSIRAPMPMDYRVGDDFHMAGRVFRVCAVFE